ncbi:heparan-alpha-glucosaminide N-acetyltransferase domain-containing protein [Caulobacter sp. 17J65-9]|uniref:DUF1624 domain-containing protein n=1 Tax=Caulobacter sp. 17J65-9 TaxID=2709382 RepID=UPI0013C5F479|nr:heparan-alpha-glucosaminide N-acetyltransferase domain-containing protein [Caulobacter sp. 17J65-9]NEX94222.1 DUF1624 domain-containing protein [Caulobacter sp. 17J65-9]
MVDTTADAGAQVETRPVAAAGARLNSIDLMRGVVIVLMVLDHVRDYFHYQAWLFDPLDVTQTNAGLYVTRWITHFCAPTFLFLSGAAALLHGEKLGSKGALSKFLLTRGLWLILLEFTLVNFAWNFSWPAFPLLVIWAIGLCMVAMSALVWLPRAAVLAVGVALIGLHNLLDPISAESLGPLAPLWHVLHQPGLAGELFGKPVFIAYPLLPWLGVMALGYGLGDVFLKDAADRKRILTLLGLAMITAFALLRAWNVYGDANTWAPHGDPWRTLGDVFDVSKYPPSLLYVLVTLGPVFLLMPWLERARGWLAEFFLVFGRVPFFAYLGHIFVAHLLMLGVGMAFGLPAETFVGVIVDPGPLIEIGWGFPLPVVFGMWLLVLVILYGPARWFGDLKRRRSGEWWWSYL